MKKFSIADGLSLPTSISTSIIALIAQRGRGKTRASKKLVEGFIAADVPVIILDSVGVWYGLRLAADGKSPGLDIPVLGGDHGDAPLAPTAGAVVADALVKSGSSAVLDVTLFDSDEDVRRFMTAFAKTFFRTKMRHRSPVHLVLEEADDWIPQNPEAGETQMLGAFQKIARKGRNFGIGLTVISQRPQGLSKKVLNLADMLFILGLSGKHERKAVVEWMVDREIDDAQREEALATMPRLGWQKEQRVDNGALIWAPSFDLFGTYKVSDPHTFDSSATPEAGKAQKAHELAKLDIGKLADAMQATIEQAKANDPALLRQKVAALEARCIELARMVETSAKKAAGMVAPAKRVEVPVIKDAQIGRLEKLADRIAVVQSDLGHALVDLRTKIGDAKRPGTALALSSTPRHEAPPLSEVKLNRKAFEHALRAGERQAIGIPATGNGNRALAPGERQVLTAVAQHGQCTREQISVLTGYTRSTRNTYLQKLAVATPAGGGDVVIMPEGIAALGDFVPLPKGSALREYWLRRLPEGESKILQTLLANPSGLVREDISSMTNYTRSTRNTYLQKLAARQLCRLQWRQGCTESDSF